MTTLVVLQPNFLPWRGVFDLIDRADVFVFLDNVQYTKQDWRNRNRIRQPDGRATWLTVPVSASAHLRILDVAIDYGQNWRLRHLRRLEHSYRGTAGYADVRSMIETVYAAKPERLVDLTIPLTVEIARRLGCTTEFLRASEMNIAGDRNQRLVSMAQAVGASCYLSGPAARSYIDPNLWDEAGIRLDYMDYPAYPAYGPATVGESVEFSIVDLLCHTGSDAPDFIWRDIPQRSQTRRP